MLNCAVNKDHSDTGKSNIDISGLLQVSDQNSPVSSAIAKKHHTVTNAGQASWGPGEGGGGNALGERLTNMEKNSDLSKIKSSNKTVKKTKTTVTHKGLQKTVASIHGVSNHNLPHQIS